MYPYYSLFWPEPLLIFLIMNVKMSHTKFPTPERKGLFMEGFPTLKWLQEAFAQDQPFDYILTRYFNFPFSSIMSLNFFFSLLSFSPNIFCVNYFRLFHYFRHQILKWEPSRPDGYFTNRVMERGIYLWSHDPDKLLLCERFWGPISGSVLVQEWFM